MARIYDWGQSDVDPNTNLYLVVWKAEIQILCSIDMSNSKFFLFLKKLECLSGNQSLRVKQRGKERD